MYLNAPMIATRQPAGPGSRQGCNTAVAATCENLVLPSVFVFSCSAPHPATLQFHSRIAHSCIPVPPEYATNIQGIIWHLSSRTPRPPTETSPFGTRRIASSSRLERRTGLPSVSPAGHSCNLTNLDHWKLGTYLIRQGREPGTLAMTSDGNCSNRAFNVICQTH